MVTVLITEQTREDSEVWFQAPEKASALWVKIFSTKTDAVCFTVIKYMSRKTQSSVGYAAFPFYIIHARGGSYAKVGT